MHLNVFKALMKLHYVYLKMNFFKKSNVSSFASERANCSASVLYKK